jgi:hypothetical protein
VKERKERRGRKVRKVRKVNTGGQKEGRKEGNT